MSFDKKAYDKEYARTHRAQMNAARKKWTEKHPEEAKELHRKTVVAWQRKNREKYNAYHRAYRAKQKAGEIDKMSQV